MNTRYNGKKQQELGENFTIPFETIREFEKCWQSFTKNVISRRWEQGCKAANEKV